MSPPCRSLLFAAVFAFPQLPAVEAQTPRGPEIPVTAADATYGPGEEEVSVRRHGGAGDESDLYFRTFRILARRIVQRNPA